MTDPYRQHLIDAVRSLEHAEQLLFTSALNIAWSGELDYLADGYDEGDVMMFDLLLLKSVDDLNVKRLIDLLKPLSDASAYLKNVNLLTDEELETNGNTQ